MAPLPRESSIEDRTIKNSTAILAIIFAGVLVYFKSLFFDFTFCDDHVLVLERKDFLSHFSNVAEAFRQDAWNNGGGAYRPLVTLSFMVDTLFAGETALSYHLTNLLIHLVVSCLVFFLLLELNFKKGIALVFSLLFTVHPAMTQAVVWIPGRMDSLFAVFILSGFIFFLKILGTKKKEYFILHFLFFLCALLSKETAVVFPFVCILYLLLQRKNVLHYSGLIYGWAVAFGIWFFLRHEALKEFAGPGMMSMAKTFLYNLPACVQQAGKIFLPFNLSVMPVIEDTGFIFGIGAIALLSFLFVKAGKSPLAIFGILWFMLFLFPAYTVTVSGERLHTDNRLYVPAIGLFFILADLPLFQNIQFKKLILPFGMIFILFSILSFRFSLNFKNRFAFYEDASVHSPHSAIAQKGRGDNHFLKKEYDDAIGRYWAALGLNPGMEGVHNNIGLIYLNGKSFSKAEEEFRSEIRINPSYERAYYNLGILYFKQERSGEARELFEKTVTLDPNNWKALFHLGLLFYKEGKLDEAERCLQKALAVNPGSAEAANLLKNIRRGIKKIDNI